MSKQTDPTAGEALQAWVDEALSRAPEPTEEQIASISRLVFGPRPAPVRKEPPAA